MRQSCALAVALAIAILTLTPLVASASEQIELLPLEGELGDVVASGGAVTFSNGIGSVECAVALGLSFHEQSLPKTSGTLVGLVNEVEAAECSEGSVVPLAGTLPWHVQYISFTGELPNIESLTFEIDEVAFLVTALGGLYRCLYRGDVKLVTGPDVGITEMAFDESVEVPLNRSLGIGCAEGAQVEGGLALEPQVSMTLGVCSDLEGTETITFEARSGGTTSRTYTFACNGVKILDIYAIDESGGRERRFTIRDSSGARGSVFDAGDRITVDIGFLDQAPGTYQGYLVIVDNRRTERMPITYIDQP